MRKNRLCYLLLMAVFLIFLFFFGLLYLLLVPVCMALLALFLRLGLQHDSERLALEAGIQPGSREDGKLRLNLTIRRQGSILAAGSMQVQVEFHYTMYGLRKERIFDLPLTGNALSYEVAMDTSCLGELCVVCREARLFDLLGLFSAPLIDFPMVRTMLYPESVEIRAELTQEAVGSPKEEGYLQNRKGNDPSEIFDLREYAAGDDVRAIHWKLSGKLDRLMVKEASDPSHYQVVLMPDLHRAGITQEANTAKLNTAVALCSAAGEELLQQGVPFCLAIPAPYGLHLREVRSAREFREGLSQWLSMELPEKSGLGLSYFRMEHMEQYFSRLLIIAAGSYREELSSLDGRIRITVICAVERAKFAQVKLGDTCDLVEIPAEQNTK